MSRQEFDVHMIKLEDKVDETLAKLDLCIPFNRPYSNSRLFVYGNIEAEYKQQIKSSRARGRLVRE